MLRRSPGAPDTRGSKPPQRLPVATRGSHTTDSTVEVRAGQRNRFFGFSLLTLLTFYLVLLIGIPQALQFAPLGGVGQPSTVLAAVLFFLYLLAWSHPAFAVDRNRQPIRVAGVLWLCAILASYVSATRHSMPGLELNGADRGLIVAVGLLGVLLLVADGIASMDKLQTLIRRIVIGATAMATIGVTQFFTGLDVVKYIIIPGLSSQTPYTNLLGRDAFHRPSSTAAHPLEFAAVLAICLPLAVHQARYAPRGSRLRRWLQVAVIALALPMTVSRTAFVGLIVGMAVILATWPKRDRRIAYLVAIGSILALRTVIPGLLGTIRNLFLGIGTDASAQERNLAFHLAAPFISAHPLFGRGFGTLVPLTYFFTDDQYLNTLVETGFIGLLALLALFATSWSLARRARRATADDELRHLAQALAASVAVALVTYATFDALGYKIVAGLTFLLLGCIGAMWRLTRQKFSVPHPREQASDKPPWRQKVNMLT